MNKKNLQVFLPWVKLDVLFFLQNNKKKKNSFSNDTCGSAFFSLPVPKAKPNPVKPRPEPNSEGLKVASQLNPFITPFSPTPSAKVSVSESSRFLATLGNEGPRTLLLKQVTEPELFPHFTGQR